jgi:transforming growth factor-beta-induced protein
VRRLVQAAFAALLIVGVVAGPVSARTAAPASIVDTAIAVNAQSGEFSTLVAALLAADPAVIARLSRTGQVTVFAPTDAAFAKLGLNASNIGSALPQATLTKILLYHVAPGARDAASVVSSTRIRTLEGGFLHVSLSGGAAYVNSSQIVATNIRTTNGIIHVIDTVLLP